MARHERMLSALTDDELESTLLRGTAEQSAYLAWWLSALAEFDRRELWRSAGFASCVQWLMARCGSSSRAARDHVQVAHRLERAPVIRAALGEGRLSFSKVRALCRVARPENEEFLLGLAMEMTASQLERHVRNYESSQRGLTSEDEVRRRTKCGVTTWTDLQGLVHHEVVTPPEVGIVIDRAIEYGMEQLYKQRRVDDKAARAEGRAPEERPKQTASERRFDGLEWICKRGLVAAERDPSPVPLDDPFLIVFHVREGEAFMEESGNINLGNGMSLAPAVAKRLFCTSMLQAMLMGDDGRRPLDLGRRARVAQPKQKIALTSLYETCNVPGCDIPIRWCQFHHVEWWERDFGKSDLENFRPLCRRHHSMVHEGGWKLVLDHRRKIVLISPTGRRIDSNQALTDEAVSKETMVARLADMGFDFDDPERHEQIAGRWGGERMTPWAWAEVGSAIANACAAGAEEDEGRAAVASGAGAGDPPARR